MFDETIKDVAYIQEIADLEKENEELKAEIEKIKKIMNINDFCENIYHYLACELDLYKADNFDCEVCSYTECTKRLKFCELE